MSIFFFFLFQFCFSKPFFLLFAYFQSLPFGLNDALVDNTNALLFNTAPTDQVLSDGDGFICQSLQRFNAHNGLLIFLLIGKGVLFGTGIVTFYFWHKLIGFKLSYHLISVYGFTTTNAKKELNPILIKKKISKYLNNVHWCILPWLSKISEWKIILLIIC